jgi:putative hemolysin
MVLIVLGLTLVGVLTAAAAAVRSVNRIWLRHWVEERLAGGATTALSVEDVQRLILAASTAVALAAFATGVGIGTRWADDLQTLLERIAIATLLVLVIGQLIPRAIGRRWATRLVPALVPGLRAVAALLAPLVSMARAMVVAAGPPVVDVALTKTGEREALEELLREGELEGVGDAGESAIISGVVDFTEKLARDVMTARAEIFHLERRLPVPQLVAQVAQAKYSRVPITDGGLDKVVGMIHAFDVLKWDAGALPPLRRVVFAAETTVATDLLSRMLRERVHLAIVQDASMRTIGLVTLEDLLEELVGEIRDEHDEHEEPAS